MALTPAKTLLAGGLMGVGSGVGRRTYHSGGTRFNALPAGAALPPPRSSPPRKTPSFETCRPGNSAPAATSRLPSPNSLKTSSVSLLSHEDRSPDPRLPEGPWYFSSRLVLLTPYGFRGSCRVRHPRHRMLVPCLAHCTCSVGTRASGCWPSPWGQAALCPPQRSARRGTDHEGPGLSQPTTSGAIIWGGDSHWVKWHCHSQKNVWSLPV